MGSVFFFNNLYPNAQRGFSANVLNFTSLKFNDKKHRWPRALNSPLLGGVLTVSAVCGWVGYAVVLDPTSAVSLPINVLKCKPSFDCLSKATVKTHTHTHTHTHTLLYPKKWADVSELMKHDRVPTDFPYLFLTSKYHIIAPPPPP